MKLKEPVTLKEMASIIGGEYVGNPDHLVVGINEIHCVEEGDMTFVDIEKYYNKALGSAATTIIINKEVEPPKGKGLIISDDPFRDYNLLTEHFRPRRTLNTFAEPKLGKDVKIGRNVVFGENVVIEDYAEIGHKCCYWF